MKIKFFKRYNSYTGEGLDEDWAVELFSEAATPAFSFEQNTEGPFSIVSYNIQTDALRRAPYRLKITHG